MSEWRVGNHYKIHVYEGDWPIATFHNPDDAQRAVLAVNGNGWQPIETAPKDGLALLWAKDVWTKTWRPWLGWRDDRGRWVTHTFDGGETSLEPTHWAPVPPPPSET